MVNRTATAMNDHNSVLIIDDDIKLCHVLSIVINKAGYTTYTANDGRAGIEMFHKESPAVVVLDLRMSGMDGIEVLKQIKKISSETPVIIITAYSRVQSAVEAIKLGAYDYLSKPFDNDEIVITVQRAIRERAMQQEIHALKTQLNHAMPLFEQMGHSDAIIKLNELVDRVAPTNFTVVLYGETGSGKEVVARYIHNRSPRGDKPFVVVDCGSIPETLIESELFGYEKGAFTGADRQKAGQFENASGGTLFLDEIGNLPVSMQNKLLRALQERQVRRLGGDKETAVDVRVVVAGNERLESLVKSGRFRMDLYQRLNEFHIEIPPLRKRKDDIVFLSKWFLDATNTELNKHVHGFTKEALDRLLAYNWPGNVRELRN
ncbi:MAG: sigma-54 dependent transcriptional regulator, partial [Planctomycetota bacterium]